MSGSDKSEQNFQESVASVDQYRLEFAPVLRSYNAMETTKRRHFDYLSMLENKKKKFNLSATAEEELTLGNLLRDHNDEVQEFKLLSDRLKSSNPIAHQALFEYIGGINRALAPVSAAAGH
jgi:Uri superfamily endonuclease